MRQRKDNKIRGFYKPKSYRFSEETHKALKKLGSEHGSLEKVLKILIQNNDECIICKKCLKDCDNGSIVYKKGECPKHDKKI